MNTPTAAQPLDLDKLEAQVQRAYMADARCVAFLSPGTILDLIAQARAAQPVQAGEAVDLNEMRIALTVQIDELIDIASAYEVKMEHVGDFDEARRVRGAVAYARKVAAPYKYNGPLRASLAPVSAQQADSRAPAPADERARFESLWLDEQESLVPAQIAAAWSAWKVCAAHKAAPAQPATDLNDRKRLEDAEKALATVNEVLSKALGFGPDNTLRELLWAVEGKLKQTGAAPAQPSAATQTETLGICCYGGPLKPKKNCASCGAWQPAAAPTSDQQAGAVASPAACSVCYGTGFDVAGKPCPFQCRPAANLAAPAAIEQAAPTDLSKRLREAATGGKLAYSNVSNFTLHAAADEIERLVKQAGAQPVAQAVELLSIILQNAKIQPDASMEGKADCYAVPLDDIDAARALLKGGAA